MEWKTLVVEIVIHFCSPDPEIKAMEHMTTLHLRVMTGLVMESDHLSYNELCHGVLREGDWYLLVSSSLRIYLLIHAQI